MATTARERVVWEGAKALRRFLVPIASLEPFPGNPRRGDVDAIRASLRRFGQVLPVLVDPALAADGRTRIVARHHLTLAAIEEGWTHVAALAHEFASEDEARAFMVADNRVHDLGPGYDFELLLAQLDAIHSTVGLDGTGFGEGSFAEINAEIERLAARLAAPDAFAVLDPEGLAVEHRCPSCGYEWSGVAAPGAE